MEMVSHGLATTCYATPAGDHTHERTTTPRFHHSTTNQPTQTTYFEPPTPRPQRLTITLFSKTSCSFTPGGKSTFGHRVQGKLA